MTNFKVFHGPSNPLNLGLYGQKHDNNWQVLRSNNNNLLVVTDQAELFARLGYNFCFTTGTQTVAPNGFLVVQITNPTGSGRSLHLEGVIGGATTSTTIDRFRLG